MASKFFLKPFVPIPVDPIITGIISHQLLLCRVYIYMSLTWNLPLELVHNTKHNIKTPTVKHFSTQYLFSEISISGSLQND
jgi:hypothetical protein